MGNSYAVPWFRAVDEEEAAEIFNDLDRDRNGYITLKDLMGTRGRPGFMMPHSLPALFFFDKDDTGSLTRAEFIDLVKFCHEEKRKVEASLMHDRDFRDLIHRASAAGVKDCSRHGRTSFRRFSSYSNVRSIYKKAEPRNSHHHHHHHHQQQHHVDPFEPPDHPLPSPFTPECPRSAPPPDVSSQDDTTVASSSSRPSSSRPSLEKPPVDPNSAFSRPPLPPPQPPPPPTPPPPPPPKSDNVSLLSESPSTDLSDANDSSPSSDTDSEDRELVAGHVDSRTISMYSTQREFDHFAADAEGNHDPEAKLEPLNEESRTAVDAAVLENIMRANIHKLADLLHIDGKREEFMEWLWKLTDFNRLGVVTLEELRIFLAALEEDGIALEELAFYREGAVPLEESIINEFDTNHTGLLTRDEFLVLADLVTREYEFWENRHLERIGDYELGRTIGRGASGIVRIATHVQTREKVAVKIVKKGKCSDLSRLDREIQTLAAARQRNVVDLLQVLESDENVFIVMELCGGGSLCDVVSLYVEHRIPEEIARNYMRQLFEALAFLHKACICHRDIRLDNLMLSNDGVLKVTDFGHSGVYTPGWDLFQTSLVGSVFNLSPEQVMGQCYSGEKIDVWSAGIVVYTLLVGHPPFSDADTAAFLTSITTATFEIPDFVSPQAADLIRCMIRVNAEDRIPMEQMLHHPWFYSGPESRPVMDTVVIPVDPFFKKRPDLAELIMAGTIHEHNLHFHLADIANPRSFPGDLRGQDWALKCMSLDINIKFTVSLFTKEPRVMPHRRGMHSAASCSRLINRFTHSAASVPPSPSPGSFSEPAQPPKSAPPPPSDLKRTDSDLSEPVFSPLGAPSPEAKRKAAQEGGDGHGESRKIVHNRAKSSRSPRSKSEASHVVTSGSVSEGELGHFERPCRGGNVLRETSAIEGAGAPKRRARVSRHEARHGHARSKSLDFGDAWQLKISRSVTVDAFPYQKVLPQREIPQKAKHLQFDRPDSALLDMLDEDSLSVRADIHAARQSLNDVQNTVPRSHTMENVSSLTSSYGMMQELRDEELKKRLSRLPAKAAGPSSPPHRIMGVPGTNVAPALSLPTSTTTSLQLADASDAAAEVADVQRPMSLEPRPAPTLGSWGECANGNGSSGGSSGSSAEFMPYIEVRLLDGESGLFLRICRKLKTICDTKLANAAERQKRRVVGRRSLSVLRRTASARKPKNLAQQQRQQQSAGSDASSSTSAVDSSLSPQSVQLAEGSDSGASAEREDVSMQSSRGSSMDEDRDTGRPEQALDAAAQAQDTSL